MNNDYIIQKAEQERDKFLDARRLLSGGNHEDKTVSDSNPLLTIDEILSQPDKQVEWLVESIVPYYSINTISGLPNHFKSLFTQKLVKSVASGESFLGRFKTEQGAVLIIDREIPTPRLKKRWKSLGDLHGLPIYFYNYTCPFKLDNSKNAEILKSLVKKHDIKLVVIDTFNRVHTGKDLGSASDVAAVFEPLKLLLEHTSVILIHHSNKSGYGKEVPTPDELLGSIDFSAETDLLFTLRKKDKNTVTVHNLKSRDSELINPFELSFVVYPGGTVDLLYEGEMEVEKTPLEDREDKIIAFLKTGKKAKSEIMAYMTGLGEKEGTINNTITVLRNKKLIDSEHLGKEAYYFLLETDRKSEGERFPKIDSIDTGNQGNVANKVAVTVQDVSQNSQETSGDGKKNPIVEDDIKIKEKQLRSELLLMDKKLPEYEVKYHEWFMLREQGIKQGVFSGIIPVD